MYTPRGRQVVMNANAVQDQQVQERIALETNFEVWCDRLLEMKFEVRPADPFVELY